MNQCNLLEAVLGFWRERARWGSLRLLEQLICELNRRQNAIPAQSRVGPPPPEGCSFARHCKFEPPAGFATEEDIDLMIMGRADWDLYDATYFDEGVGLATFAKMEPWAHEQLDYDV